MRFCRYDTPHSGPFLQYRRIFFRIVFSVILSPVFIIFSVRKLLIIPCSLNCPRFLGSISPFSFPDLIRHFLLVLQEEADKGKNGPESDDSMSAERARAWVHFPRLVWKFCWDISCFWVSFLRSSILANKGCFVGGMFIKPWFPTFFVPFPPWKSRHRPFPPVVSGYGWIGARPRRRRLKKFPNAVAISHPLRWPHSPKGEFCPGWKPWSWRISVHFVAGKENRKSSNLVRMWICRMRSNGSYSYRNWANFPPSIGSVNSNISFKFEDLTTTSARNSNQCVW